MPAAWPIAVGLASIASGLFAVRGMVADTSPMNGRAAPVWPSYALLAVSLAGAYYVVRK